MTFVKNNLSCPRCGHKSFSVDDKGWGKCFNPACEGLPGIPVDVAMTKEAVAVRKDYEKLPDVYRAYRQRGLSEETIRRYKVFVSKEDSDSKIESRSPLFTADNDHCGNKLRFKEKGFSIEGDLSAAGLFGRHAFPAGSAKAVTVTEGYEDAMAAFQMTGGKFPCVSVHSASSAVKDVKRDFEYLNSFDTIVFAFDGDEPGQKAAKACAQAGFPLGKVKVLTLRKHKDANAYLQARESESFSKEWWQAPTYKPDGLKMGTEIWGEIIDRKEHFTTGYPFEGMDRLTFGIRLSELVVVTADTGVGKTAFLKHIEHKLLTDEEVIKKGYGVGFLHLEEPNGDTALGLLSIHNRVPYHIPGVDRPEEELRRAYDEVLNNDRVVIWDHFGSNSVDAVLDKVRHMAALGCKYIVLDHLSIIVSDQAGDERKQLDEITTKLKTLTMELDLAVIAVIHTNRAGQIRGTAGVEQLANIVVRLERDKTDASEWRRNVTKVTVEKNRFCGYTGPACYLWYNKDTSRLNELEQDEAMIYEAGGDLREDQVW